VVVSKLDKVPETADAVVNAENIKELNKFIQLHYLNSKEVPTDLDSLVYGAGTSAGSTISGPWAVNPWSAPSLLQPITVTDSIKTALNNIGLISVHQYDDAQTTTTITTNSTVLAQVDPNFIKPVIVMGEQKTIKGCIVLGMGDYNRCPNSDVKLSNIPKCPLVKKNPAYNVEYKNYLLLIKVDTTVTPPVAEYVGFTDPTFMSAYLN
ncbi:MAG: hypothetical protein ABIK28_01235, partial [Planctomycetota bacterium]